MSGNVFWREENMSDDDILWLVEYTAKVQAVAAKQAALAAAREERAAITTWLRSEACFKWLLHNTDGFTRDQAAALADAIASLAHLGGDDE